MIRFLRGLVMFLLDFLESVGICFCLLIAGPFKLLRHLDGLWAACRLGACLFPSGLVAPLLRAELAQRLGNHVEAGNLYGQVISSLEQSSGAKRSKAFRDTLVELYGRLVRIYLTGGRIDDATITVIRAHKSLGVDRLAALPDFDLKTAHIVKAGIAAGRLLEEGGLATLLMKEGSEPLVAKKPPVVKKVPPSRIARTNQNDAKVIPFPVLQRT